MPDANEDFLRATMGAMDLVYNIARSFAARPEDAEDLVQETYLAAFRAWQDDRRPRRPEAWLATICLNVGRSAFRRRGRRPRELPLEDTEIVDQGATPEERAMVSLEHESLRNALWALPDEQRTAIALVDLAGFSTAEAAEIMQTPRGTVLSRLHRGRRGLATLLSRPAERPS